MTEIDRFIYTTPLWLTYAGTVAVILLSIHGGFILGRSRKESAEREAAAANTVVGTTIALLAFMLAFTFGMTASRYEARKQLSLDEVNSIERAFFRAGLIREPHRSEVRTLLKRYVDIRVDSIEHPEKAKSVIEESEKLQRLMWQHAEALADEALKNPDIVTLFIDSLNEMFEMQTQRITLGIIYRLPIPIWAALFLLTMLSMFGVGYLFGMSGKENWALLLVLSIAFSTVILLIADIEQSSILKRGFIRISPKPILSLQQRLHEEPVT